MFAGTACEYNGETSTSTVSYIASNFFKEGDEQYLSRLLYQIKNPDFKNPELDEKTRRHIFEIECYHEYTNKKEEVFKRGRVYHEESSGLINGYNNSEDVVIKSFMQQNSKQKFISGGCTEDVPTLTYEEVCEAYDEYIHPSNSLTFIEGRNWKDTMKILRDEYLNEYDKKEFSVSYDLDNPSEIVRFSNHKIKNKEELKYTKCLNSIYVRCNSQYKARIGYFLDDLTDEETDIFRAMMEVVKNPGLNTNKNLKDKGFLGFNLNISCEYHPYITINLFSDRPECFSEEILKETAKDIIKDFASENTCVFKDISQDYYDNYGLYKDVVLKKLLADTFAYWGDPFSERRFTIEDGKIITREQSDIELNKDKFLSLFVDAKTSEIRFPDEIMVLEREDISSDELERQHMKYFFEVNGLLKDGSCLDRVVFEVLKRNIIVPYIQEEGLVYNPISGRYNNKLGTYEISAVPGLIDFFENDFPEIVRDFEVTPEMLEKAKSSLVEYCSSIDEDDEETIEENYKDKIQAITTEDVQNIIRCLSVSHTG